MPENQIAEPRVLVADDDPSIRQLVCTIVKREGFSVDCAADGVEAVEYLERHDYTVILLDLMMPRLDGFGVIQWLKTHQPEDKPVVLVITAYADQRFKDVDPDLVAGVIRKPFEIADLGTLVRLCVSGFDSEVAAQHLYLKTGDPAIRELMRQRLWARPDRPETN